VYDAEIGKCGFIDRTGALKIPCKYADAENFSNGLAAFENEEGRWGFIDTEGNVAVEPFWEYTDGFENPGFANVYLPYPDRWDYEHQYFIDRSGGILGVR